MREMTEKKKSKRIMTDVAILYANDTTEWSRYLAQCLENHEGRTLHIQQEDVYKLELTPQKLRDINSSRVVLVIFSPLFLDYLDEKRDKMKEICTHLRPTNTIAMLCGVGDEDLKSSHLDTLVSYGSWQKLAARNKDRDFVWSLLNVTLGVVFHESAAKQSFPFKLVPRKVTKSNNKIYLILQKPQENRKNLSLFLDDKGSKEISFEWDNPYTIHFNVPDSYLGVSKLINVILKVEGSTLGIRPLKCESKMCEIHNLLNNVASPYEFMCEAFGVDSLHELDGYLAQQLKDKLPKSGFDLLDSNQNWRYNSEDVLPTLLHFASHYGLKELTTLLVTCPGAKLAFKMPNVKGLTPTLLATQAGYTQLLPILEQCQNFQKSSPLNVPFVTKDEYEEMVDSLSKSPDQIVSEDKTDHITHNRNENIYLQMTPSDLESLAPHQRLLFESSSKGCCPIVEGAELVLGQPAPIDKSNRPSIMDLPPNQKELIEILKAFKKGLPYSEVEHLFKNWRDKYMNQDNNSCQDSLNDLREMYKAAQKQRSKKPLRHFFMSLLNNWTDGKTSTLKKKSQDSESDKRPVSILSIASHTSTGSSSSDRSSTISSCDSGNNSEPTEDKPKEAKLEFPKTAPPRPPKPYPLRGNTTDMEDYSPNYYNTMPNDYINFKPPTRVYNKNEPRINPNPDYDFPSPPLLATNNRHCVQSEDSSNYDILPPGGAKAVVIQGVSNPHYFIQRSSNTLPSIKQNTCARSFSLKTETKLKTSVEYPPISDNCSDYYDVPRPFNESPPFHFSTEDSIPQVAPPPPPPPPPI